MAYLAVRKNLIESSKSSLRTAKFLLWLFQVKDFVFQAKICLKDSWSIKSGLFEDGQVRYWLEEVTFYLF